jgi:hypothetical protein
METKPHLAYLFPLSIKIHVIGAHYRKKGVENGFCT